MKANFHIFNSKEDLTQSFSNTIIEKLEHAIETKDKAVLLVSGGNTPKVLFEKLRTYDIAWEKVVISLVDERWVNEKHEDSNAKLVKENLLKDKVSKATFIPLYQEYSEAFDSVDICSELVKKELFYNVILILVTTIIAGFLILKS